jgi:hypothetical protein
MFASSSCELYDAFSLLNAARDDQVHAEDRVIRRLQERLRSYWPDKAGIECLRDLKTLDSTKIVTAAETIAQCGRVDMIAGVFSFYKENMIPDSSSPEQLRAFKILYSPLLRGAIYSGVCEVLMAVLKEVKDKRCLDVPLEVKRLRELMAPNIEAIIDSW